MKSTWIALCQEVVQDRRTGEEAAGSLVGIRSDCEVIEYKSLDDAAVQLAATTMEVRLEVPRYLGGNRWRELPPLMQAKFLKIYTAKRKAALGNTVPVGMAMTNRQADHNSEPRWSIFFFAKMLDGEQVAYDLDGLADIVAPLGLEVTGLPESRPDWLHNLPEGWLKLLNQLVEARHLTAQIIERAQR